MNPSLKSSLQVQALAAFGFGKGPCSKSAFVWCRGHETKDLSIGVSKLISFISIFSKMSILRLLFQNLCKLWHIWVFIIFHQKVSYESKLVNSELLLVGVLGCFSTPRNLGVLLTLFQPEGSDYAHHIAGSIPGFGNLTTALELDDEIIGMFWTFELLCDDY